LRGLFDAPEFPAPDLVLWLRVPVATALARMGADATERFERAEFSSASTPSTRGSARSDRRGRPTVERAIRRASSARSGERVRARSRIGALAGPACVWPFARASI
jgi:hypothetical protein